MKNLLLIFIIIPFLAIAQKKKFPYPEPPNGVHLYDNLFMDETVIFNVHWLEFLYYLKNDSTQKIHNSNLPDTMVVDSVFKLYKTCMEDSSTT